MREVHRRPPEHAHVSPIECSEVWEEMRHEEGFHDGATGVEGGECTEDEWGGAEGVCVARGKEDSVNTKETAG